MHRRCRSICAPWGWQRPNIVPRLTGTSPLRLAVSPPHVVVMDACERLSSLRSPLPRAPIQPSDQQEAPPPPIAISSPVKPDSLSQPPLALQASIGSARRPRQLINHPPTPSHLPGGAQDNNKASLTSCPSCPHPTLRISSQRNVPCRWCCCPVQCVRRPSSAAARIRPPIFTTSPPLPLARRRSSLAVRTLVHTAHILRTASAAHASRPPAGARPAQPNPILARLRRLIFLALPLLWSLPGLPPPPCTSPAPLNLRHPTQPSAKTLGRTGPACCPSFAARSSFDRLPAHWASRLVVSRLVAAARGTGNRHIVSCFVSG